MFVLETDISVRDDIGHKEIDWDGAADSVGYYVSNGGVQKIHWSKEANNENSYLRFYDESGQEISINRGKIYIALSYMNPVSYTHRHSKLESISEICPCDDYAGAFSNAAVIYSYD